MIAVIADDLTGAAEIGGLGLRYGLKVVIRTSVPRLSAVDLPAEADLPTEADLPVQPDLLIIATDTRSMDIPAAVRHMREVTGGLLQLRPRLLYKKLDSVLRGHVIPELAAQLEVLGRKRALIVPANPALGRTITGGIYYVKGKPLHETGFGADPEFAIHSSHVLDILKGSRSNLAAGGNAQPEEVTGLRGGLQVESESLTQNDSGTQNDSVVVARPGDPLPSGRFIVGEAGSASDLGSWAEKADGSMLVAGASDFFSALLDHHGLGEPRLTAREPHPVSVEKVRTAAFSWGEKKLFVCGSAFSSSREVVSSLLEQRLPVCLLPEEQAAAELPSRELPEHLAAKATGLLARYGYAVIAATGNAGEIPSPETARAMRKLMAAVVAKTVQRMPVNELLLEGGATASAVFGALQMNNFYPRQELAQGVIRMSAAGKEGLYITVKPGSYPWPDDLRALLK